MVPRPDISLRIKLIVDPPVCTELLLIPESIIVGGVSSVIITKELLTLFPATSWLTILRICCPSPEGTTVEKEKRFDGLLHKSESH